MNRNVERIAIVAGSGMAAGGALWFAGPLTISVGGDFVANVAGATIGGLISVGLAVLMFRHERDVAVRDAVALADQQRHAAIRDALRFVRAIRECVEGGHAITINNAERIVGSLTTAVKLTRRALDDPQLTDFPLRLTMEDAAKIGEHVAPTLQYQIQAAGLADANTVLLAAAKTCDPALNSLDELIADYTKIRMHPAI